MKILPASPRNRAVSALEVVVIIAVVGLLAGLLIPPAGTSKNKVLRIACGNQLKSVAVAFRIWAGDHGDQYPMAFYTNAAGLPAFADSSNAFRYFQVLSNELSTPKIAWCPADRMRRAAVNFTSDFNNQQVSYFVGLQANELKPDLFLAGDRNLTNGLGLHNGVLELAPNQNAGWSGKLHQGAGNVALSDCSVSWSSSAFLEKSLARSMATNWLLFP